MARTRSRTGYGQLMLLAALLLGIVTMHTLGHPSGGHDGGASTPAAVSSPMGHDMAGPAPAAHEPAPAAHERDGDGPRHGERAVRMAAPAPEPHDGMSMDPLSVCLAVLGAFTLVLLVRAGLLRPGGTLAQLPASGRLPHTLRPDPPPPRIRLARLSVLRI
ncbi:hypothetical protein [Streptomyces formicae]|uniref:Uncharacterized protein n=1 Tax=Streptomyces formicae TaxID=1616117 RepID=A0A291Q6Z9_9ACTN|nr:hypothetical protein [Streptomyces formicae]ATL27265.1 hypothetical protein KY5_2247 [Streptomyces formicae]